MKLWVAASRLVTLAIVVVLVYLAYIVAVVIYQANQDEREQAQAIVVLGAAQYNGTPSPVLAARLDHAAALWNDEVARTIVVTGGSVEGDRYTEAAASAAYLGTLGVPDENVLREVDGRNTWESLQATALFLKARDINRIVLVSDPFHDARVKAMANELGFDAQVSPTTTSPIQGSGATRYYAKEVVSMAVGTVLGWNDIPRLERLLGRNALP